MYGMNRTTALAQIVTLRRAGIEITDICPDPAEFGDRPDVDYRIYGTCYTLAASPWSYKIEVSHPDFWTILSRERAVRDYLPGDTVRAVGEGLHRWCDYDLGTPDTNGEVLAVVYDDYPMVTLRLTDGEEVSIPLMYTGLVTALNVPLRDLHGNWLRNLGQAAEERAYPWTVTV